VQTTQAKKSSIFISGQFILGTLILLFFCLSQAGIVWAVLSGLGYSVSLIALTAVMTVIGYMTVYLQKSLKSLDIATRYKGNRKAYKLERAIIKITQELGITDKPYITVGSNEYIGVLRIWGLHIVKEMVKDRIDQEFDAHFKSIMGTMTQYGTGCAERWKNELDSNREVLGLMKAEYNRLTSTSENKDTLDKWYLTGNDVKIINDCIEYFYKMNSLKLMKDPKTKYFGDVLGSSIGYANILIGNSFLGLYGAVVGFTAIFALMPQVTMSIPLKIAIASIGGASAGYAAYVMTLPFLRKCIDYFQRVSTLVSQGRDWKSNLTLRNVFTTLCWVLVMIAAVQFNVVAVWHLPEKLAVLFPNTSIGYFFDHFPLFLKYFFAIAQGVITLFCGGAIYLISCFNQYIGRPKKSPVQTIAIFDKIASALNQFSISKICAMTLIFVICAICTWGQVVLWLQGLPLLLQYALVVPATSIYFALFCESAINCLEPKPITPKLIKNVALAADEIEGDRAPDTSKSLDGVKGAAAQVLEPMTM
tara:strand:- start:2640 stop:4238 length:1599 start_codon:yes stop_codon:yes gene_type:complete